MHCPGPLGFARVGDDATSLEVEGDVSVEKVLVGLEIAKPVGRGDLSPIPARQVLSGFRFGCLLAILFARMHRKTIVRSDRERASWTVTLEVAAKS